MILRLAAQTRALEVALADRESLEVELRHQAFHDSLTGLPNRALLSDRIAHALAAATRTGSMVAVCLCDLDGFKTINDSLGHPVGDAALVAAGERLSAVARPGDTVARLGGDEFAVLLRDIESPRAASDIGGRIVSALHQPVEVHGRQITLSARVGVAVAGGGSSGERLLSEADSAMYEAKASGKDRCVVFEDAMHVKIVERMELINALPGALERHEFFLEYQPQISLGRRQLEGFEALLRWQHPTLGLIGPDRFVHLAEETGHILPIGRWVIEEACQQAVRWRTGDDRPMSVSVNLSGHQLKDPDLLRCIRTALSLTRLRPEQLVLEITESVLIVDVELTVRALEDLKQLGVRLAIDDFGTGYSSLSYLNRFPIDSIKIDKTFVGPLGDPSSEGTLFVQSIIRLAHDLGLRTVAEGMETVEQRDLLTQLGCDGAQGFLLSRPLSAPAAQDFVVLSGAVASRHCRAPVGVEAAPVGPDPDGHRGGQHAGQHVGQVVVAGAEDHGGGDRRIAPDEPDPSAMPPHLEHRPRRPHGPGQVQRWHGGQLVGHGGQRPAVSGPEGPGERHDVFVLTAGQHPRWGHRVAPEHHEGDDVAQHQTVAERPVGLRVPDPQPADDAERDDEVGVVVVVRRPQPEGGVPVQPVIHGQLRVQV
jgi:diguanylate cyclase (GGDEF)-like protein